MNYYYYLLFFSRISLLNMSNNKFQQCFSNEVQFCSTYHKLPLMLDFHKSRDFSTTQKLFRVMSKTILLEHTVLSSMTEAEKHENNKKLEKKNYFRKKGESS
jgi:hypothetical protein